MDKSKEEIENKKMLDSEEEKANLLKMKLKWIWLRCKCEGNYRFKIIKRFRN